MPGIHKLQADAPDSIHPKHLRSPWRAWCPQYPKEAGVPLPPCHRAGLSTESRGLPAGRTACPVPAGSPGGRSPCPGLFLDTAGTRGQDGRVQPPGGGLGRVYQHGRSPAWAGRRLPVAGRAAFTSRDSGGQRRHGPEPPSPAPRKCLPAGVSATGARQPGGAGGGARQRQTGLAPRGRAAGSEDSLAGTRGLRQAVRAELPPPAATNFLSSLHVTDLGDFFFFSLENPPSNSGTLWFSVTFLGARWMWALCKSRGTEEGHRWR